MTYWKLWVIALALWVLCLPAYSIDREAFSITRYDLDVQVEPEQQRLAVRGTILLTNDSRSPKKLAVLQLSSSLTWRSIRIGDELLQFVSQPYVSDIDHTGQLSEAIVTLPKEIAPAGTVELNIGYEGVIVSDSTRLTRIGVPKETAIHSDWDEIGSTFSAVRGVGYVVWYPIATEVGNLSEGDSLFEVLGRWKQRERGSSMRATIHLPQTTNDSPWHVLCNGDTKSARDAPPPKQSSAECSYAPFGWSSPAFVVGNYFGVEQKPLAVFYRPEHKTSAESFELAAEKVKPFVTEWFGVPKSDVVVADLADPGAAPFEAGRGLLLTPFSDTDPKLLQIAMVHELTHSAFDSPNAWIGEGLAHFAQAVYRERQDGREVALDFMGLHRSAIAQVEQGRSGGDSREPIADRALATTMIEEFYRSKAAYVWWMLRDMLGDDVLRRALEAYRPAEDTEKTYMQRLLQKASGRDLQWFFDSWVYQDQGLPDFRVASAFSRKMSGTNYVSTVTVENIGDAAAEIPVTIRFENDDVTQRLLVAGKSKAVVRLETPRVPIEVVLNDGSVPESDLSNNTFKLGSAVQ